MRCFLFGFGGKYWFIGYCFLFLLVTTVIGWQISVKNLPLELYKPKKIKGEKKIMLIKRLIKNPVFTYIFANVLWGIVVIIVAKVDLKAPKEAYTLYGTKYEPWTWGVASFFITWVFALMAYTIRLALRRGKGIRDMINFGKNKRMSTYMLMLYLTYAIMILVSIFWYVMSDELFILLAVLFVPLILICVFVFKINFTKNNYRIFADIKELNKLTQQILDREDEIRDAAKNKKRAATKA